MKNSKVKYASVLKEEATSQKETEEIQKVDRKSTRLNSSHPNPSRMPSSA